MRFLVASKAHLRVLKQLVPDNVAECVVLLLDSDRALVSLATVLDVCDPAFFSTMELTYSWSCMSVGEC